MREEFIQFLETEGVLPTDRSVWMQYARRQPAEPIGSIAFCHGMLTGQDVDKILEHQRESRQQFGEIAVEMGILDDRQIERLLEVQRVRATMETAEAIILSGMCPTAEVVNRLGCFLSARYQEMAGAPQHTS